MSTRLLCIAQPAQSPHAPVLAYPLSPSSFHRLMIAAKWLGTVEPDITQDKRNIISALRSFLLINKHMQLPFRCESVKCLLIMEPVVISDTCSINIRMVCCLWWYCVPRVFMVPFYTFWLIILNKMYNNLFSTMKTINLRKFVPYLHWNNLNHFNIHVFETLYNNIYNPYSIYGAQK